MQPTAMTSAPQIHSASATSGPIMAVDTQMTFVVPAEDHRIVLGFFRVRARAAYYPRIQQALNLVGRT
jgi:hypothetical protein